MENDAETVRVNRSGQSEFQSELQQPTISVTEESTSRRTSYMQYRFPNGRPLSTCSIESVGSFVCSEASSWISADFDDDHLLHAVHRLSMSSCSSWTVSELGDDPGVEGQYEVDDGEESPVGETDQLIEDSLLTLAYLNGRGDDNDSAMSCRTRTASDSCDGASNDSVISASASRENTKDIAVNTLLWNRKSRLIEDCDIDLKVKLDITLDDARVSQALLMQQDSTLLAMSEARILQLPYIKGNMTPTMMTTSSKSLMSKQLCGLTGSKTLNRLGKLPDVTAVATRSMSTRRQVAHLNFWERMTSNALSEKDMKRRSMLY